MNPYDIEEENLDRLIDLALDEDGVSHDLATLSIIPRRICRLHLSPLRRTASSPVSRWLVD